MHAGCLGFQRGRHILRFYHLTLFHSFAHTGKAFLWIQLTKI